MRWISSLSLIVLLCGIPLSSRAAEGDKELAEKAYGFFKKYCAACHHGEKPKSEVEDYDVLDYNSLTKKREDSFYVKGGAKGKEALKQSDLWARAGKEGVAEAEGDMPPKKFQKKTVKPIPTDEERVNILQKWLEAGAPRWPAKPAKQPTAPAKKAAPLKE